MILVDPDRRTWRYLSCETHERRQNNAHSANRREIVYRVVKEVCGSAGQSHSHGVSSCSKAWIWWMLPTIGQSEPRRPNVVVTGSEQAWPAVCPGIPEVASTKHNKWWLWWSKVTERIQPFIHLWTTNHHAQFWGQLLVLTRHTKQAAHWPHDS